MTPLGYRKLRDKLITRAETKITALYRPLTAEVVSAIQKHSELSPTALVLILRDIDASLDKIYGRFPGDTSAPFYRLVVSMSLLARYRVFQHSKAIAQEFLSPEAIRAIEERAV